MAVIAFIHTRAGSKRCPGKNTREIAGHPLVAHAIMQGKRHPMIDRVVVSTDCPNIGNIAQNYGAEVLMRPEHLCTDDANEYKSWQYACQIYADRGLDVFVNLPATCPLRADEDITNTIEGLKLSEMVFTSKIGREFIVEFQPMKGTVIRKAPMVIIGACYVSTPAVIMSRRYVVDGPFVTIDIPDERSLDIDTEHDFLVAKLLMERK